MIISSLENKEIKRLIKLKEKKQRDIDNEFLVEGEHLVEEAYKSNLLKKIILIEENDNYSSIDKIVVTKEIMKKITTLDTPPNIMGLCRKKKEIEIGNKVLILDDVQDPGNLGTIVRSAVAFNIDTIILSNNTVDLYNNKTIRSTQGMLFHINIVRKELKEEIKRLKDNLYTIYTTDVESGKDIKKINVPKKYALIMGNEGNGVSLDIKQLADEKIYIKTNKSVESLNVGVATSILLYELGGNNE